MGSEARRETTVRAKVGASAGRGREGGPRTRALLCVIGAIVLHEWIHFEKCMALRVYILLCTYVIFPTEVYLKIEYVKSEAKGKKNYKQSHNTEAGHVY